jgi:hypothetical protein
MADLFHEICMAIDAERYVVGIHADERLRERRITAWQIIAGVREGTVIKSRLNDRPNPCIEIRQSLADGTPVKTVWAWLAADQTAKLVTVHFFDR